LKEFSTAANRVTEGDEPEPIEFGLDGVLCKAYYPKDGQVAVLMATGGKHSSDADQIAGVINFFVGVLDDDSHSYIVGRLLDRKDPFGLTEVQNIIEWLMEQWSGRPTKSSVGSTDTPSISG
jgi:hypothetical protein